MCGAQTVLLAEEPARGALPAVTGEAAAPAAPGTGRGVAWEDRPPRRLPRPPPPRRDVVASVWPGGGNKRCLAAEWALVCPYRLAGGGMITLLAGFLHKLYMERRSVVQVVTSFLFCTLSSVVLFCFFLG
ncbi:unnamed protein product, partial [Heterosigma akashiwo]